jgi:hypothetical protein
MSARNRILPATIPGYFKVNMRKVGLRIVGDESHFLQVVLRYESSVASLVGDYSMIFTKPVLGRLTNLTHYSPWGYPAYADWGGAEDNTSASITKELVDLILRDCRRLTKRFGPVWCPSVAVPSCKRSVGVLCTKLGV